MMRPLGGTDMSDLEALKERVRILEQRSRRFRLAGIGLALSVIASLAFAQHSQGTAPRIPDVIEAKRFVLKDDNGFERAVLADRGFGPHLEMYRQDGKTLTASFGSTINDDGFALLIGKRNVIQIDGSSVQLSEFADKRQLTRRAALGSIELQDTKTGAVTTQPVSSLVLFDKEGKVLFRAP
jgi:hypothetical protein